MIVFDLKCVSAHRFEGWFGSSDDYERQLAAGLVACPECGSVEVSKAPMAPSVGRKGNQVPVPSEASLSGKATVANVPLPPQAQAMMQALAEMQAKALESSRWVGDDFVEQSRAMHYGETEIEPIHGEATLADAAELLEEGIEISPLPFPVAPPGEAN